MNHSLTLALLLSASAGLTTFAGTPVAPAAVTPVPVSDASLLDTVGATLEAGYDSRYYHRGFWLADNMTWAGLNVQVPLSEKLTLGFSAFYTRSSWQHDGKRVRRTDGRPALGTQDKPASAPPAAPVRPYRGSSRTCR